MQSTRHPPAFPALLPDRAVPINRDELKGKLDDLLIKNADLKTKLEQTTRLAGEATILKDELDIAKEEALTATRSAAATEQWRRRAEEATELRQRCAQLEAENAAFIKRVEQLEQVYIIFCIYLSFYPSLP
ncbi:unnamed protein product [Protopolystoma xenopodis]|uniref:Uncharacterized protein n=1 Tax=Protopolystoma xenopodis TaxID=117903 RepID=A0A448XCT9_9PLAT|nr:unnamed protein product [Protopolystoma xenopodis]